MTVHQLHDVFIVVFLAIVGNCVFLVVHRWMESLYAGPRSKARHDRSIDTAIPTQQAFAAAHRGLYLVSSDGRLTEQRESKPLDAHHRDILVHAVHRGPQGVAASTTIVQVSRAPFTRESFLWLSDALADSLGVPRDHFTVTGISPLGF